jgi:hypothetical protein
MVPSDGGVYQQLERVAAAYSCAEEPGGIGLASCSGSVPPGAPIDTGRGTHTFTVTATDVAGNSTSRTVAYATVPMLRGLTVAPARVRPGRLPRITADVVGATAVRLGVAPLIPGTLSIRDGVQACRRHVDTPVHAADYVAAADVVSVLRPVAPPTANRSGFEPWRAFPRGASRPDCRAPGAFVALGSRVLRAGDETIRWDGTVKGRRLPVGHYELTAVALDASGHRTTASAAEIVLLARATPRVRRVVTRVTGRDVSLPGRTLRTR